MENLIFAQSLGRAIRLRRVKLKLSQEALAVSAGLHRTYIGAVERAERNITVKNLVKICIALRCAPSELLISVEQDSQE